MATKTGTPKKAKVASKNKKESEFDFIDWIRKQTPRRNDLRVGPGDDCAVALQYDKDEEVLTVDMVLDGTHFDSRVLTPQQIGRKAIAVSLSDVAAMGCMPDLALVSVALPRKTDKKFRHTLFDGMKKIADEFDVIIAGGDVTVWDGPLAISSTLIGHCPEDEAVLRSGAKNGDAICVTGDLGGSQLGKHHTFTPRIKEGLAIRERTEPHAMIDISDGLVADLMHILTESNKGAVLYEENIPISDAAKRAAKKSGKTPLEHALTDGEDYELLMCVEVGDASTLARKPPAGTRTVVIGRIHGTGLRTRGIECIERPLKLKGYEHF